MSRVSIRVHEIDDRPSDLPLIGASQPKRPLINNSIRLSQLASKEKLNFTSPNSCRNYGLPEGANSVTQKHRKALSPSMPVSQHSSNPHDAKSHHIGVQDLETLSEYRRLPGGIMCKKTPELLDKNGGSSFKDTDEKQSDQLLLTEQSQHPYPHAGGKDSSCSNSSRAGV